jgi:hypothetical protein
MKQIGWLLCLIPLALNAQTTINGGRIILGTFDASGSERSLPLRTGTGSPAGRDTCEAPGETYFQTDATPGQNFWGCTAAGSPGTWNQITGTGSAPVATTVSFSATPTFTVTGSIQEFTLTLTGNVASSTLSGAITNGILVFNICQNATGGWTFAWPSGFSAAAAISSSANSCTDQIFVWNGTSANPIAPVISANTPYLNANQTFSGTDTFTGTVNNSGAAHTLPAKVGPSGSIPGTCTQGEVYFATNATAGQNWYYCTATNTWIAQTSSTSGVTSFNNRTGAVASQSGDYNAAQVGALADPGANGIVKRTSADVTAAAAASDVVGLFASCSGTQYLGADGNCHTASAGGNASITQTVVTYSATPAFAVTTNIQEFILTLTGNVTSSTITGVASGDVLYFEICQNSTGGYSVIWPTSNLLFTQAPTIDTTPNVCTKFHGTVDNGTPTPTLQLAGGATTTETQFLLSGAAERQQPTATPASGLASLWPDSSRHTWTSFENGSGNIHIMPRVGATGTDQLSASDVLNAAATNASNTFSGSNTFSSTFTLSGITGSTQCLQANSSGVVSGTGSACGSSGGSGANASGYYVVTQSSNEPANAVNLGSLSSGILKQTVASGVATPAIATSSDTFPGDAATSNATIESFTVGTGGVTANTLVITDTSNPAKVIASTGSGAYGVALSTVSASGTVSVQRTGQVACLMDNAATAGDIVIPGTTTVDYCRDSGQTNSASISIGTRVVGVLLTSASAGNTAIIELTPAHFGTEVTSINLSSTPTQCSGGQVPTGITTTGSANGCFTPSGGSSTIVENTYLPATGESSSGTTGTMGPGAVTDTGISGSSGPTVFHGSGYGIQTFTFASDSSTAQYYYITWMLHQNWSSSSAVNVVFNVMQGSTTGTAAFSLATACPGTSTSLESLSWNTNSDQTVTVSSGGQFKTAQATFSNISMTGCSAGAPIVFRVGRDQTSGSGDNMSGSIYLLGIQVQWSHT